MDFYTEYYFKKIGMFDYYLSNDFDSLLNVYLKKTCGTVSLQNAIKWKRIRLNRNIQKAMDRFNVKYSMTFFMKGKRRIVVFNKRINNDWYRIYYIVKPSRYEKINYWKRKHPFYFYIGYFCGSMKRLLNLWFLILGLPRYPLPSVVKPFPVRGKTLL